MKRRRLVFTVFILCICIAFSIPVLLVFRFEKMFIKGFTDSTLLPIVDASLILQNNDRNLTQVDFRKELGEFGSRFLLEEINVKLSLESCDKSRFDSLMVIMRRPIKRNVTIDGFVFAEYFGIDGKRDSTVYVLIYNSTDVRVERKIDDVRVIYKVREGGCIDMLH